MADDTLELLVPPYQNDRGTCPKSMLEYEEGILTPEQQEKIHEVKVATIRENNEYLGQHPEVNALVSLIMRAVFANQPSQIPEFIGNFVSRPTFTDEINEYLVNDLNTYPLPTDQEQEADDKDENVVTSSDTSPEVRSEKEDQLPLATYRKERTNRPSRVSFVGDKPLTRDIFIDRLSIAEEEEILKTKHKTASHFFSELLEAKYQDGANSKDVVSRSQANSALLDIDSHSSSGSSYTTFRPLTSGSDHRSSTTGRRTHSNRALSLSRKHLPSATSHTRESFHYVEPKISSMPLTMIYEKEPTIRSVSAIEQKTIDDNRKKNISGIRTISNSTGYLRNNSTGSFKQESTGGRVVQPVSEILHDVGSGGTYLPILDDDKPQDAVKQPDDAAKQPENAE